MTCRVAVIGAGAAGLAAGKAMLDAGVEVVLYEKGDRPGGLWARDNASGLSPAYASLHTNTSKGRTEFADLPMPRSWPDYPSADLVAEYLAGYAERFGVVPHIRFGTEVVSVERDGAEWVVTTGDGDAARFDAVVVANGHNWDPRWPDPAYPGAFTGMQLHAHDYRTPEVFRDRRVLVVGMGNSAMDIAVDASHVAHGPVLLSARRGVHIVPKYLFGRPADATGGALAVLPWRLRQRVAETMLRLAVGNPQDYGLPAPAGGLFQNHPTISDTILHRLTHGEVEARPGIERMDGEKVVFADGTADPVDVIVWATGYRVGLPFLPPALVGDDPERLPLYKRVFHLDEPSLAFVGLMQSTGAALPIVEAQAKLAAAYLSGRYALPPAPERRRAVARDLRAARARWGDRRPMMRVDFDRYVADLPREARAGRDRLARGARPFTPMDREETTHMSDADREGTAGRHRAGERRPPGERDPRGLRVLVTGASGTFGRAISARLTGLGARVVGLDAAPRPDDPVEVIACDLTDDAAVPAAVAAAIERLGGLDVLVNNAGIGGPAPAELPPGEEVRRQLDVNLLGTWRVTAACVDALVESRGRVVMLSSRMAVMQLPLAAAYGASKRALVAYADALRMELGTHVGVTCVYPSAVRSPIHDSTAAAGLSLEGMSKYEPLDGVVDAVLRAALSRRPRRDVPTTRRGAVEFFLARHVPALTDRIVARTFAGRVRSGAFKGAALAAGAVRRHTGRA
ncbi:SDR family NAD(P)-dependent oxidoreductase [Actinomadura sp. GC306]|uniref:SDR family NAD(P)-dependent oxidoreductase n=1 Tax=Actinomadura sp. GC306 TaxID=2530367 RepID=UPI00104907E8|nr:SDR family NAD(P)-dependent oxidoreductase [Actinomadura sp. GC306]TDC67595.1 SDR family NAD(P)-dependent oxidoreductase [Actinomadura sp. GC306]